MGSSERFFSLEIGQSQTYFIILFSNFTQWRIYCYDPLKYLFYISEVYFQKKLHIVKIMTSKKLIFTLSLMYNISAKAWQKLQIIRKLFFPLNFTIKQFRPRPHHIVIIAFLSLQQSEAKPLNASIAFSLRVKKRRKSRKRRKI